MISSLQTIIHEATSYVSFRDKKYRNAQLRDSVTSPISISRDQHVDVALVREPLVPTGSSGERAEFFGNLKPTLSCVLHHELVFRAAGAYTAIRIPSEHDKLASDDGAYPGLTIQRDLARSAVCQRQAQIPERHDVGRVVVIKSDQRTMLIPFVQIFEIKHRSQS